MKIGIDCRLINKNQNTGISRYTEFLIEYYMSRYDSRLIYLITNDSKFNGYTCNVVYTKLHPYRVFDFLRFNSFIDAIDLDVYHSPFYSGLFARKDTMVSIVTVHDLMFLTLKNFFSFNLYLNSLKRLYFNLIVKRTLAAANIIICVSKTTKDDVHDMYGLEGIHIPESSEILVPPDEKILKAHGLRNKSFYFYCGNNRPHKNLSFIIDIFNSNISLPPLVLAGKGHASGRNIVNVGVISDSELSSLYKASIAFIFPSKYEGFGLPVLEALRSRTFVIASRIPAFLEFDSPNIFYFNLEDKEEFLTAINQANRSTFSSNTVLLDQYSKDHIYDLLDQVLQNISSKLSINSA